MSAWGRGGGAFLFLPSDSLRTAQPGIEPSSAKQNKTVNEGLQKTIKATDTRICSLFLMEFDDRVYCYLLFKEPLKLSVIIGFFRLRRVEIDGVAK